MAVLGQGQEGNEVGSVGHGSLPVRAYLLTREVAELLRTPESTLRYWRHTRTGPPSIKLGRRVVYRREAVQAWLQEREQAPLAPPRQREHTDRIAASVRRRTGAPAASAT